MKPLNTASSKLIFPPEDLVTVSTRFTKVMYAQLKSQQQFSIPVAWKELITWPLDEDGTGKPLEKMQTQLQMGMKVTSGFEMLISDPNNDDNRTVRETRILLEDLAVENDALPSDSEIQSWKYVNQEDDENWLNINFEDFNRELQGKSRDKTTKPSGAFGPEIPSGFGDAKTEADLKKMVERFEAFLNNEDAGVDGAEMDDMDVNDDDEEFSNDDDDDDSEDEDKEVSFDENEFARMMREMMGMPSEEVDGAEDDPSTKKSKSGRIEELDSEEEDKEDEAEELRQVMQRMETELNAEGALNLDPTPKKLVALKGNAKTKEKDAPLREDWEDESDDEDADIDFNLAKNLLESFKSQAGLAGPGGNLIGMMGMQLPRDEDDTEPAEKKA